MVLYKSCTYLLTYLMMMIKMTTMASDVGCDDDDSNVANYKPNTVDCLICVIKWCRMSHPHSTEKSAFLTVKLFTLRITHHHSCPLILAEKLLTFSRRALHYSLNLPSRNPAYGCQTIINVYVCNVCKQNLEILKQSTSEHRVTNNW